MADRNADGRGADASAGHATHDLERIAALLDDDLPAADRMVGEAMVAACADCARVRDDVFALARAAGTMPAPQRMRDFRLTAADAARLAPIGRVEPSTEASRRWDDMFDPHITAGHPAHDTILVAALVDHSLPADERDAAQRMVDTCRLCGALHVDLLALRAAARAMPTRPRPRDYRLTTADAERLRPIGFRRWIVALGSSRDALTRPLAIGLTTLGIVGLLVSGAPLLSAGSETSSDGRPAARAAQPAASQPAMDVAGPATGGGVAAEPTRAGTADAAASAEPVQPPAAQVPGFQPAASAQPANGSPEFLGDQGGRSNEATGGAEATGQNSGPQPDRAVAASGAHPSEPGPGVPPIVIVSGILLIAGLGLFLLRWSARRFGA